MEGIISARVRNSQFVSVCLWCGELIRSIQAALQIVPSHSLLIASEREHRTTRSFHSGAITKKLISWLAGTGNARRL